MLDLASSFVIAEAPSSFSHIPIKASVADDRRKVSSLDSYISLCLHLYLLHALPSYFLLIHTSITFSKVGIPTLQHVTPSLMLGSDSVPDS